MPNGMQPDSGGLKIASVHIENVKRVKAFHLEPSPQGLTIVGGRNGQGKTSVLDAIAWALGGAKMAPSKPQRDGALNTPAISITLSNGLVAERKGKNSELRVVDPSGRRSGQTLLDEFVSVFALDLPKFLGANDREKAATLLQILGIGDQLAALDDAEKRLYNERHQIGQMAKSKLALADELPEYPDAPAEPVSISDLLKQQQDVLARNGANEQKRREAGRWAEEVTRLSAVVRDYEEKLAAVRAKLAEAEQANTMAQKSAQDLHDESTAELEQQIANFEALNTQIAANQQKAHAQDEAAELQAQYSAKDIEIQDVRAQRLALLSSAPLPLPGLSVVDAELVYNGQRWDCMSSSEQLRVAVAIVRNLKPECRFVLMDKLEQMDIETLRDFGAWLTAEGLQVIATRVSTGEECSIIIEDGLPVGKTYADMVTGIDASEPVAAVSDTMEW